MPLFKASSDRLSWKCERRGALEQRPATLMPRSQDLGGAEQGPVDAPSERDADEGPEQRGPGVETALADTERAMLDRGIALEMGRLELGDLSLAHVPLRGDRLDQIVADNSRDQHRAQNVHGAVV